MPDEGWPGSGDRTGQNNTRGIGWEYVHVCIDDASRIAFSKIMKDERKKSAAAFPKVALAYYANLRLVSFGRCADVSLPSPM